MIRLSHPEINAIIEFKEGDINTLIIENQNFFRFFIGDIFKQLSGEDGLTVLSDNYKPIDISKNVDISLQFTPFEINKKSILTKINNYLEKEALNEQNYIETQDILSKIENYIENLLFLCTVDLKYDKLSIGSIIKSMGITINEEYENEIEKIIDYIDIVRDFDRDKVFIFVNIRSYYNDQDMQQLFNTIVSKKIKTLFIEGYSHSILKFENRIIIDKDLCEI